jgi:Tfp pilus assembly major pilin PilA
VERLNKVVKYAAVAKTDSRCINSILFFAAGTVRKKTTTNKQQATVRKINTGDHNLILLYFMPYPQLYYGIKQR